MAVQRYVLMAITLSFISESKWSLTHRSTYCPPTMQLFSMKVQSSHNASKNFALLPNENKNSNSEFVIRHFVGPIVYEASNFVERNREHVSIELLKFATKSSNALITSECCELICRQDKDSLAPIDLVRRSAEKLSQATRGTQAQHVWCIKPNEVQSPSLIDHRVVLRHLQAVDVSTAAKFSDECFANKLPVYKLCERYACLLSQKQKRNIQQMEPGDRAQYVASNLITRLVDKRTSGDIPFACGATTVYFKAGVLAVLEQRRRMVRETNAILLQDFAFKAARLERERKVLRSIVKIQSLVATKRERSAFRQKKESAIHVQAVIRCRQQKQKFQRTIKALTVLRFPLLRRIQYIRCRRREAAATRLGAWYRSQRDMIIFHWFRQSLITLQASWRKLLEQKKYSRKRLALSTLSFWLKSIVDLRRRCKASTAITGMWRSKKAHQHYASVRKAALTIQRSVRRCVTRSAYKEKLKAAYIVVGACTRLVHRLRVRKLETSATTISSCYRAALGRRSYRRAQIAAITIQSVIRGCISRSMYEKKSKSARVLALACMEYLRRLREARENKQESAARLIVEVYRSKQTRERYKLIRTKTITIQSLIRMNRQSRAFKLRKATSQAAARRLVTWYRSHSVGRRQRAARIIQKRLRSHLIEKSIARQRNAIESRSTDSLRASNLIAVWYRSRRARHSFVLAKASAMKIQAEWRAKNARDEYLIMKGAVLSLESWVKECVIPQIHWNREVAACIIQAWIRSVQARKIFNSMKRAARIVHAKALLADNTLQAADSRAFNSSSKAAFLAGRHDAYDPSSNEATSGFQSEGCFESSRHSLDRPLDFTYSLADALPQSREKLQDADNDALITELSTRIEQYKQTVATLQSEVEQVTEFASRHAQEMESEFEEKVSLYEDEVLAMKQEIIEAKNENQRLKDAMEAAEKEHEKTLKAIQKGVQKTQSSHRDYLDKIMALLDDTEVARKTETDRIREELEMLKRERDSKNASLKEEIELLRSLGFGSKKVTGCPPGSLTQGARKLAQKLKSSLSPDNIVLIVKEAQERPGTPQRYIDSKLSSQAIKHVSYLEEMIQIADIAATEQAALVRAEKQQLEDLEVELSRAYQEYGRLQRKGFI